jgi:hypothetical protein
MFSNEKQTSYNRWQKFRRNYRSVEMANALTIGIPLGMRPPVKEANLRLA